MIHEFYNKNLARLCFKAIENYQFLPDVILLKMHFQQHAFSKMQKTIFYRHFVVSDTDKDSVSLSVSGCLHVEPSTD